MGHHRQSATSRRFLVGRLSRLAVAALGANQHAPSGLRKRVHVAHSGPLLDGVQPAGPEFWRPYDDGVQRVDAAADDERLSQHRRGTRVTRKPGSVVTNKSELPCERSRMCVIARGRERAESEVRTVSVEG